MEVILKLGGFGGGGDPTTSLEVLEVEVILQLSVF